MIDWAMVISIAVVMVGVFFLGRQSGAQSERARLRKKFHEHTVAKKPLTMSDLPDIDRWEESVRSAEKRRPQ